MSKREDADRLHEETAVLRQNRERREQDEADRKRRTDQKEPNSAAWNSPVADRTAVHTSTAKLDDDRDRRYWFREKLANWREVNHKYRNIAGDVIARHVLWFSSQPGILIVDVFVFSAVGREMAKNAKTVFGAGEWVIPLAIVAMPLAYLVIELVTGSGIKEEERNWKGTSFAVLVWLGVPFIVVGFSFVDSVLIGGNPAKTIGTATLTAIIFLTTGRGILALAAHGAILFFGPQIIEANGYVIFKVKEFYLSWRLDRLDRAIAVGERNVETSFRNYYARFHAGNNGGNGNNSNGSPNAGPFSARERRVVNRAFGDEVIEDPKTGQKTTEDPEPPENDPRPNANRYAEPEAVNNTKNEDTSDPGAPGDGYDMDGEDEIRP